ncbi:MAG TPA: hypothetical protein VFR90_02035 [Methylibium sp.]|uniref:hypothetical protein n=1 Tax=Methylibium sp. TaxID=2067992 RepID=UPI002DBA2D10|nr:hypothetical protein [Methylibium sp.]HEU4457881.1 hypothetical protein [Methylibium sp.]
MNPMMNKVQWCAAGDAGCAHLAPRARRRPVLPSWSLPRLGVGVMAVVAGTVLAALAAATLVVARTGEPEPLAVVELPRVVIEARRDARALPPGACPVPTGPAASCPVPTEAARAARAADLETFQRTPR